MRYVALSLTRHAHIRIIVTWPEFVKQFRKVHSIASAEEERALKTTIDLLENDHVSWFEFDIFTRLFQPWSHIMNNWNAIAIAHPGYKAYMTYDEVEHCLKAWVHKPGRCLELLSCFNHPTNCCQLCVPAELHAAWAVGNRICCRRRADHPNDSAVQVAVPGSD